MKIMVLGDIHVPYANTKALYWASLIAKQYKPDIIIQLGDIVDHKAWSRFPKDADDDSPALEWKKTVQGMKYLHQLFPKMTIILGNHDRRVARKATEAGIPSELIKSLSEQFMYSDWVWYMDNKPLVVDGITFIHGDEVSGTTDTRARTYGTSLVEGHSHRAYLEYITLFDKQIFALMSGWLGDDTKIAFRYAAKNPNRSWLGITLITDGVPHLLPYGSSL